jgi:hypothetical protein
VVAQLVVGLLKHVLALTAPIARFSVLPLSAVAAAARVVLLTEVSQYNQK